MTGSVNLILNSLILFDEVEDVSIDVHSAVSAAQEESFLGVHAIDAEIDFGVSGVFEDDPNQVIDDGFLNRGEGEEEGDGLDSFLLDVRQEFDASEA